jgi:hypothetical protein
VLVLRDLPRPPWEIPPCVARSMHHLIRCAFSKQAGRATPDPVQASLRRVRGLRLIDPAARVCAGDLCPAVIHNLLVYREQGHLTATFATTLGPWLARRLSDLP